MRAPPVYHGCRLPSARRRSQQRIVRLLVETVIVSPNDIEMRLRANGFGEVALELRPAVPEEIAA
jgi:hypothetical protein